MNTPEKAGSPIRPVDDDARALARALLDKAPFAALAHLQPETGHPLVTRTGFGLDADGAPLLLMSELSAHFTALSSDGRCSLLIGEPGQINKPGGDPLTHPRLTLIGRAALVDASDRQAARTAYLARNPKAKLYVDFADFHFWRITPERAFLNGGFGKAFNLKASDLM
ncbi:MAG: HugZ family protein [Rhizobiales bacterium]|nr:HugZ family protein [Hyphomicrobiales bacterium]MBO6700525.1 HugZ family protein [Hyphomicrobiales bacterium]MBO6738061.1 HugZ family protein [Hyphomicrobiales bacterium]MBO6913632.1 HugZ family protein [Hyphomicrobiales bacterium]MBO6954471.1 HugZ family protein [Hyphomicrobiales bacterium]